MCVWVCVDACVCSDRVEIIAANLSVIKPQFTMVMGTRTSSCILLLTRVVVTLARYISTHMW